MPARSRPSAFLPPEAVGTCPFAFLPPAARPPVAGTGAVVILPPAASPSALLRPAPGASGAAAHPSAPSAPVLSLPSASLPGEVPARSRPAGDRLRPGEQLRRNGERSSFVELPQVALGEHPAGFLFGRGELIACRYSRPYAAVQPFAELLRREPGRWGSGSHGFV